MDFMSHLFESMLCSAMSRSPGVRGDTDELPSPATTNSKHRLSYSSPAEEPVRHGGTGRTVLSSQQAVEDLLHNDWVQFDQFGQSQDDFGLFQPVDDGNQEPDVRNSFVVQVSDSFHQLRRRRHWRDKKSFYFISASSTDKELHLFVLPLSVKMCRQRVTSVSAPLGQFSTRRSSSGEFIPIPRIYKERSLNTLETGKRALHL